jgi:membrane-associated protease RseP (regulator of RpoE activity)
MEFLSGLLIFLVILNVYLILVLILAKKGILEKHNISLAGPMLMFRTKRGLEVLDKIARPNRFWKYLANIGVVVCFILMIGFVGWAIIRMPLFFQIPAEFAPTPQMILVIPGINPLLPLQYLAYVIIALIVTMVVHEFSHGILLRAQQMKVKSLGLLYMIIPLGAFTEEDEEELKSVEKRKRLRVLAMGPTANFIVAFVCMFVFSVILLGSITPVADGVVITNIKGEMEGIEEGMIITAINGQKIDEENAYTEMLEKIPTGEVVKLSLYKKGKGSSVANIVFQESTTNAAQEGKGYLRLFSHKEFLQIFSNPFQRGTFGYYISLPFLRFWGEAPFPSELKAAYNIPFNEDVFWVLENTFYWIFWLNFLCGLTNILPITALDGGYMFQDAVDEIIKKLRVKEASRKKMVSAIGAVFSIIILLVIIIIPLIAPRI